MKLTDLPELKNLTHAQVRRYRGLDLAAQTYIHGLIVTKNSGGNTLDISAGAAYVPASSKIVSYAGATGVSAGTLGASQWNQVYLYESGGAVAIEVANNAAPPSTAYAGTARQGGTNSNRRWIGCFKTDASSNIKAFDASSLAGGGVMVSWRVANTYDAPHRVLSAGSSTTYAAVSVVDITPRYAVSEIFQQIQLGYATTAATNCVCYFSLDGSNVLWNANFYVATTGVFPSTAVWMPVDASVPQYYYKVDVTGSGSGPRAYCDVTGFKFFR